MSGELDTAVIYYYWEKDTEALALKKEKRKEAIKQKKKERGVLPFPGPDLLSALCLDVPSCKCVLGMRGVLYER